MSDEKLSRRAFLGTSILAGAAILTDRLPWTPLEGAPAIITSERLRPKVPGGVQTGDPRGDRAIIWSQTDRSARLQIEWATNEYFRDARIISGPAALKATAYTAKFDLSRLPPGEQIFYRVRFESLRHPGCFSEPVVGTFRTAANEPRAIRIAWSGDVAGQGWGINPDEGGMTIFETMRRGEPDLFIHSGDNIYADQPLEEKVKLEDGTVWRNIVTEAKSKVAETLDDFRGNFEYNLLDDNFRRFHASVPVISQWDDHEVLNNWFPGLELGHDDRYSIENASLLAARAKRALFEFLPLRRHPDDPERIYRRISYGPLLEIFVLDLRSYRGPNTPGREERLGENTLLGAEQFRWLKEALRSSRAVWKVIASDLPIGLVVPDWPRAGKRTYESWANADDGPPLGRELELAELLAFMKRKRIRNTVWVTADVHYAAAHHYSPERAKFKEFDPFWEFVAGPMHAGTFGPNILDGTFGPEVAFSTATGTPGILGPNRPPRDDTQYFGILEINPRTKVLTAVLHDRGGRRLWSTEIEPIIDPKINI